jgi:probable F420-dependent oxidoreductase
MQFYQSLLFAQTDRILELAAFIDQQTPFDGVFLGDHTVFPVDRDPGTAGHPVPWTPQTHWPDIGAVLGAIAAVTERIHMTTSVMILPLRQPIDVAKMIASLAALSGDRVSLGVGIGWMEHEFIKQGVEFKTRGARCDEMMDLMRLLWTGEEVHYKGAHFDIAPSVLAPAPAKRIPLYVGGETLPAMRRAAQRGDGWLTDGFALDSMFVKIETVRRLRREAGRENEPFAYIAMQRDDLDRIKRLRDLGCTHIYSMATEGEVLGQTSIQQRKDYYRRYADNVIAKL